MLAVSYPSLNKLRTFEFDSQKSKVRSGCRAQWYFNWTALLTSRLNAALSSWSLREHFSRLWLKAEENPTARDTPFLLHAPRPREETVQSQHRNATHAGTATTWAEAQPNSWWTMSHSLSHMGHALNIDVTPSDHRVHPDLIRTMETVTLW